MADVRLGKFIRPFNTNGVTFYLRGLTVGEYTDLLMSGALKNITNRTWFDVAYTGIVDWEGFLDKHGNPVTYSLDMLDNMVPESGAGGDFDLMIEDMIVRIGQEVFYNLTMPNEEEVDKFVASTRFLHFRSDPKNKSVAESYNCETCLKKGMAKTRPCGRFTDEEIDRHHKELNSIPITDELFDGEPVKKLPSKMKNRYKASSASKRPKTEEQIAKKKHGAITVGGFQYPECPVSYIDEWIGSFSSILYSCAKSNLNFFSGGVVDQSYKMHQLQRIVSGEANQIESEEMDKIHKKK